MFVARGSALEFHPRSEVIDDARLSSNELQTERQAALERLGMAISHQLVATRTSFGLRAFRAEQVTEARRAAHELARSG
jgi:hypothetical protein